MAPSTHQLDRIAGALERIADVMEEQMEMQKIPMLDAATVLKAAADDASHSRFGEDV